MNLFVFLCLILVVHFFADFVLQTRRQATNKSSSFIALGSHLCSYWLGLFSGSFSIFYICFSFELSFQLAGLLAGTNLFAHGITDLVTSKLTTYFYKTNQMHKFWCTIGADQLAHLIFLIGSIAFIHMFHPGVVFAI